MDNIVTINGIPVYQALISGENQGMCKVSLVDYPAIESNFVALAKENERVMYRIEDEERRLVRGVVMRADFPIYRKSAEAGEYYIIYKAETIRAMAEKYLLDSRQNNVNLMHKDGSDVEGVQMVQYFIKDTQAGVNPEGFADVAEGSLFAEFHIVNDDVWNEVKAGTYRGFSLEGVFDLVPLREGQTVQHSMDENEKNNNTEIMARKKINIRQRLAQLLLEFGSVTTDKGIISWDGDDDLKAGMAVYVEDEKGNRTSAPDGDYRTHDGKVVKVASGKVTEIADDEAEVADTKQKNRKEMFEMMKVAFSMSYNDKTNRIAEALRKAVHDFYIMDAGDDFVVICEYDKDYNSKYMRYSVSWEGDNATVSDGQEVRMAFIPVDMEVTFSADMEQLRTDNADKEARIAELSAQVDSLGEENRTLTAEVERLRLLPQAKPAHEEFADGSKPGRTGNSGIDNLVRIMKS